MAGCGSVLVDADSLGGKGHKQVVDMADAAIGALQALNDAINNWDPNS